MRKSIWAALASIVLLGLGSGADARLKQGQWALGISYPGFGARYLVSDALGMEARAHYQDNVLLAGLRQYYFTHPFYRSLHLFAGLEEDYVSFKTTHSQGRGYAFAAFAGGEYFFSRRFSFLMDFGPAYVQVKDSGRSISESGLEIVFNFGLNWHFGGR